jgi:serine/threonine-protein kinase
MDGDELTTSGPTLRSGEEDTVPAPSDSAGRVLAGERYRLGASIGRGGMGDVIGAFDLQIGREVAIKRLHEHAVTDSSLERFMREACIQGQLDHPAIVPVHELGVDERGLPFFVMKKLTGTTLTRQIGPVEQVPRLLRAFVDVCLATEFAHRRGFVHRDLKPDNIVIGDFGEVYILDWGVAKTVGPQSDYGPRLAGDLEGTGTRDGIMVGTPGYMAPEQARGQRDVDARADVYALGCVLFEILAGERLHPKGPAAIATTLEGTLDARPSRRTPDRDVPPELDALCVFATATDPAERIASARELADHVQRYLDGDRDLAQRKSLARDHLEEALTAFTASGVARDAAQADEHRRSAMRLAGRAIALDPTLHAAVELVGRLMIEPPRIVPREVAAAIAADTDRTTVRAARAAMLAHGGYLLLLPLLFVSGFSSPAYPIAMIAILAANFAALAFIERRPGLPSTMTSLVCAAAMVGLIARMFSPFLAGPALAAVSGMGIAVSVLPATRRALGLATAVMISAVLVPWILEELGVLSTSFEMLADAVVFRSPSLQTHTPVHVAVLVGYTIALVCAAMVIAGGVRRAERAARESLHLQAWQLRQLVPASAPA